MRVRVIKDFSVAGRYYHAGEVVDIDPTIAGYCMKDGLVMQDKSLDGAKETKAKSRGKSKTLYHQ